MTKKTFSKVIAAVLVASLCLAAVFTASVSAETATCTVTGNSYNLGTVGAGTDYVLYEVNFTSSSAFVAGSFTLNVPSGLTFVDCSAKASSVNGYTPNVYINVGANKVLFAGFSESASNDIRSFTSLDLVLKFAPSTVAAGTQWTVSVQNITITNAAEASYACSNASATSHIHDFGAWSSPSNGIETRTCSVCSAVDKRVASGASVSPNNLANTVYANLTFTADGDTVLNALVPKATYEALGGTTYFAYKYKDDDGDMKSATSTTTGLVTYNNAQYYSFPCGKNGGIGRMSRPIEGNFINVGSSTTVSALWSKSIKAYLDGTNGLITSGTTAQQNYAKALWNYGYYTTKHLTETTDFFDADLANYTGGEKSVADWGDYASLSKTAGGDRTQISKIDVKTGFKPSIRMALKTGGNVTVSAYSNTDHDTLVYKKTIQNTTANTYFTISDIPTKYLTGDIVIEVGSYSITYSFGRYAKALYAKSTTATNTLAAKWMMNYSYYLSQAFA